MKQLGIRFKDNDFHSTFMGLLSILGDVYEWRGDETSEKRVFNNTTSKFILATIINDLSLIAYRLYQAHDIDEDFDDEHYKSYLEIGIDNIYLDKEVQEFIDAHPDGHDGSFFVLDMNVQHPKGYKYCI